MASLLLNCSLWAHWLRTVLQLADEAPFRMAKRFAEDGVPLVPHDAEQDLWVVPVASLWPGSRWESRTARSHSFPSRDLQFTLDERPQTRGHELQTFADTFPSS